MDHANFWGLIGQSRVVGDTCEAQAIALQAHLTELPAEEIRSFDGLFLGLHGRTYRWDLWGAACIINGGASDDGFFYFRSWLIGQGRAVYEGALRDPEMLADVGVEADDAECEALMYVAAQAYEAKAGTEMPMVGLAEPDEPVGQRWDEDHLEGLFPRLCARFDGGPVDGMES